jgi:uncharacterized protein YggE
MKKDNSVKITGMIVGAVVLIALLGFYFYVESLPKDTIQASGSSIVSVDPDVISVYFNVETRGDDAKEAKDANAEIVDEVITALIKEGFERREIVTQNFNVYEEYDWSKDSRKSIGFKATHSIRVELSEDKLDMVGEVVDAGIDSGALLNYINFELSRELENQYKAEALRLATEDARVKAEAMASGAGGSLGRIVSVNSNDFGYRPYLAYVNEAMALDVKGGDIETSIQVGERDVSASVSVVFELK